VDQGNPASEGDAVAVPRRARLTPLRAALLVMGAVFGGVALSLILGSSPAHAADDPGVGHDPLAPVVSAVATGTDTTSTAVGAAIGRAIPGTQHVLHGLGGSLVSAAPAAAPLVAPVLSGVDTALGAVDRMIVPTVDQVLRPALVAPARMAADALASSGPMPVAARSATTVGTGLLPGAGGPGATIPTPLLTSTGSAGAGALGVLLLTLLALAMLGRRVRRRDGALPASPAFDTDTSPA
jgi:MYXO-CTERM domain-containing protein